MGCSRPRTGVKLPRFAGRVVKAYVAFFFSKQREYTFASACEARCIACWTLTPASASAVLKAPERVEVHGQRRRRFKVERISRIGRELRATTHHLRGAERPKQCFRRQKVEGSIETP
jgi:hypothetical protein